MSNAAPGTLQKPVAYSGVFGVFWPKFGFVVNKLNFHSLHTHHLFWELVKKKRKKHRASAQATREPGSVTEPPAPKVEGGGRGAPGSAASGGSAPRPRAIPKPPQGGSSWDHGAAAPAPGRSRSPQPGARASSPARESEAPRGTRWLRCRCARQLSRAPVGVPCGRGCPTHPRVSCWLLKNPALPPRTPSGQASWLRLPDAGVTPDSSCRIHL